LGIFVSIFQFFVLCGHLAVKIFMTEIVFDLFDLRPEEVSTGSVVLSRLRHHSAIFRFGSSFCTGTGATGTRFAHFPLIFASSSSSPWIERRQQHQSVGLVRRHVGPRRHIPSPKT
jgi:hypothetical protein